MSKIQPQEYRSQLLALTAITALAGCVTAQPGQEFNDPIEPVNRAVHSFNVGVDRVAYRPASIAYGTVIPQPIRQGVSNMAETIDTPKRAINSFLQGNIENGFHNTARFILNATGGVLGFFDPASTIGLDERNTDFGETLYVWGAEEGAIVNTPFFGPYTQRHLTGEIVDIFLNPFSLILNWPNNVPAVTVTLADYAADRYDFRDTLDTVLYESTDSYAQTRQAYLENRRFRLGATNEEDAFFDPYEELYAE
ncbi:MAG: VacJ family lipoprotein [Mangrovicoccus sp.]|nr:VacJ family lipoprotein [Mangrovicoccus sp.]